MITGISRNRIIFSEMSADLKNGEERAQLSETGVRCMSLLMSCQGEVVTKKQIHEACWGSKGVFVSDASVRQVITQLRRAFEALGAEANIIATHPRQGYVLREGIVILDVDIRSEDASLDINGQSDVKIVFTPRRQWYMPGNTVLCVVFILSVLTSWIVWNARHPPFMQDIQYVPAQDSHFEQDVFIQQGYLPPSGALAAIKKAAALGGYSSEEQRYIYINRTDLPEYTAAFICRSPLDSIDSHCISILILRGDHGY